MAAAAKAPIYTKMEEVEVLKKTLAEVTAERDTLKAQVGEATTVVKELKTKLSKAEETVAETKPIGKVGGKSYLVIVPVMFFQGKRYTAAELAKDKEAMAALVDLKSEALVEVK